MINIPKTDKKRIVIAGCGFAGLTLARKLKDAGYQVVMIDKHNYHQFPPLFYQVASAGLEPESILFPIRKIFQNYRDYYIRKAEIRAVVPAKNQLITSAGALDYDYLVLAFGATNSFFGSKEMEENSRGMKTIAEVLDLRNTLLMNFENAITAPDETERNRNLNIVIIGGGPSGVEISGALAEMNKYIIPKDYPEQKDMRANIYLLEAASRILGTMSEKSSAKARKFLEKLGVKVLTDTMATGCNGQCVTTSHGDTICTSLIIWTAGIKGNKIDGLDQASYTRSDRIMINDFCRVKGYDNIFALGDIACMNTEKYPAGHPQVAQVAIQQAKLLSRNLIRELRHKPPLEFRYRDLGTMATVGRNLAVVELPYIHFEGIFAWFVWMFVHLMSIVGVRNRLIIFINWAWKYITYDQSLRLILRPKGYS
ncbi:MAG: NAD(P)/FAD-dependent oxidoreductase [Bacteroidales bacterium]|jgi:NADH dehydrogenase